MPELLDNFIKDVNNKELLQVFKSIRNGAHYGAKIRFAHSLVMSLLYKRNISLTKRFISILRITKDHSIILAIYALIYKVSLITLNKYSGDHGNKATNEFISGLIGGLCVYGKISGNYYFNSGIVDQITLYCSARVGLALGKILAYKVSKYLHQKNPALNKLIIRNKIQSISWSIFASLVWATVMYIHRFYPKFLQHGLESSMTFIYDDYNWHDWKSLFGI
ncbi:hypothetical protein WICMUC_003047 [Wickerhamomyces mucosus]|uniref:Peroxisomal membrane protein 4 n=1 Tax=Wickerhamomyces mucosus TaxID=1378264 RepID=A0A9P8PNX6_9ASCO|nr:hypothetical protein WICMUC_003047 [Wickerhamomyces mucosus]